MDAAQPIEVWRDIEGYGGRYRVSNLGRVKSFARNSDGHILSPRKSRVAESCPYTRVCLMLNGVREDVYIHKLVYTHFIGEVPTGKEIDHVNKNSLDNRASNLQAITHSENIIKSKDYRNTSVPHRHVSLTPNGRYAVKVRRAPILHHIGTYENVEDAVYARDAFLQEIQ